MKANELRIGNLVEFDNHIKKSEIVVISPRWFCSSMEKSNFEVNNYYNPIQLTEEWLVKFGFILYQGAYYNQETDMMILKDFRIFSFDEVDGGEWYLSTAKYVHQLQNLYFAITNKELEINE